MFGNIFHSNRIAEGEEGGERGEQQQQKVQRKKSQRNWPKIGKKSTTAFWALAKTQQVAKYLHSDAQWQLKCNAHWLRAYTDS